MELVEVNDHDLNPERRAVKYRNSGKQVPETDTCPQCINPIHLRCGEINRPHWAHYPGGEPCPFTGAWEPESEEHMSVKTGICDVLNKMFKFPELIHVEFFSACSYCGDSITIHIPPEVVVFKTEYYHVTGPKKYVRWDVVGLNAAGTPVFGIEIMHTHATMESPERSTISWVELETEAVIKKLPVLLDKGGELEIANVRRGKATFCSTVCEETSK
jgi:hypothetical protein